MHARVFTVGLAIVATSIAPVAAQKHKKTPTVSNDDRTIVHVLNRIGYGPAPGDIEKVRRIGLSKYIDLQLHPERIEDDGIATRLAGFDTLTMGSRRLAEEYFIPAEMQRRAQQAAGDTQPAANTQQAMSSRRQTTGDRQQVPGTMQALPGEPQTGMAPADRQVMVELSSQKILRAAYSDRQLEEVMVDFWFNHFNVFAGKGATRIYLTEDERDVLRPHVLGKFRDLLGAVAASPAMLFYLDNWQSSAPNGMNRAGLNENYARELMELHTLGVDGGYTQADVQEVARAFTGWTIDRPRMGGGFVFRPRMHDAGEKVVLGHHIKAGGGKGDGDEVLDILAEHPSTATFIATKLARRFVADDPPPALVRRAAARFHETHGDIREVIRTIVTSPEFLAPAAYRAKVKSPDQFVVSAVRATGVEVWVAAPLVQAVRTLGMPLYQCQPPTGYGDRSSAWVNSGALLARMNFAVQLSGGGMRAVRATSDVPAIRDALLTDALAGDVSPATRDIVARAERPAQAVALLLGSPEFQRK